MVVLEGFGDDLAHGEIDEGVVVGHEVQNLGRNKITSSTEP